MRSILLVCGLVLIVVSYIAVRVLREPLPDVAAELPSNQVDRTTSFEPMAATPASRLSVVPYPHEARVDEDRGVGIAKPDITIDKDDRRRLQIAFRFGLIETDIQNLSEAMVDPSRAELARSMLSSFLHEQSELRQAKSQLLRSAALKHFRANRPQFESVESDRRQAAQNGMANPVVIVESDGEYLVDTDLIADQSFVDARNAADQAISGRLYQFKHRELPALRN